MAMSAVEEDDIVAGINVTPLVDVCLVLVIIFMVTAPLMSDPVIKVTLPQARTQEGEEKDKITVTLAQDGRFAIDHEVFKDFPQLRESLRGKLLASESKLVILRADKDALHGKLTELMAEAKEAGAQSLTIATEQKK